MKISVVTAVMNGADTLPRAIQSLRQQCYSDIEHIVQDGGSTDGSLEFLRCHGHPNMAVVSAKDAGIYDAINTGISRATGDVIGLLHADDQLASSDTIAQVARAMRDPEIDGVYGDLQYIGQGDPAPIVRHWKAGPYSRGRLKWGWMPPHPTLYLRREVFERLGAYDASFRISGDYDAMLRYLVRGNVRFAYIPQVMVRMQVGGASNRSVSQMMRKSREDYRAIRRHRVGGVGTLIAKNLSKLPQFFNHP
ncbi:glycosyltransferase family 2 protein [Yoonia maritima]|uniref:glycosyltransferase family 2 protein n=1 Tax=Yoonia maritima TaxID=1435347 RepID=UPI000D1026BE|nr:glycosyltransferase family 2 protein [Yoonia maritima]